MLSVSLIASANQEQKSLHNLLAEAKATSEQQRNLPKAQGIQGFQFESDMGGG